MVGAVAGGLRPRGGRGDRRFRAGQQLTNLALDPGETIRTPRILLVFWAGPDPLRGNNLFRQLLIRHVLPRRNGKLVYPPICASVNEVDPDGNYEGPHVRVMPALAERGFEVFWSDMDPQQWYPGGFPEGTGTWEVDPVKYPHGLKPVGDAAHKAGIDYLLWFEPERVHFGTKIQREHPEWVMKPDKEWSQLFGLHIPEARRWITDLMDGFIKETRLDWMRWDFNVEPLGFWRRNDAPDRQGMTENRYIEGLYAMWDDLRARHPDLVIDNLRRRRPPHRPGDPDPRPAALAQRSPMRRLPSGRRPACRTPGFSAGSRCTAPSPWAMSRPTRSAAP